MPRADGSSWVIQGSMSRIRSRGVFSDSILDALCYNTSAKGLVLYQHHSSVIRAQGIRSISPRLFDSLHDGLLVLAALLQII